MKKTKWLSLYLSSSTTSIPLASIFNCGAAATDVFAPSVLDKLCLRTGSLVVSTVFLILTLKIDRNGLFLYRKEKEYLLHRIGSGIIMNEISDFQFRCVNRTAFVHTSFIEFFECCCTAFTYSLKKLTAMNQSFFLFSWTLPFLVQLWQQVVELDSWYVVWDIHDWFSNVFEMIID